MINAVKTRVLTWAGELTSWVNRVDPSWTENSETKHLLGQEQAGEMWFEGWSEEGLP